MEFELFSKRQNPVQYDVYSFDDLPEKLRNQIYHVWRTGLGLDYPDQYNQYPPAKAFIFIREVMCKEHGLLILFHGVNTAKAQCANYLLQEKDIMKVLDIIELSLIAMKKMHKDNSGYNLVKYGITQSYEEAVEEINKRFKENGIGYEYLEGRMVRKDSEFIYQDAVKPAITLLHDVEFKGAAEEFLHAHELFKIGKNKEAVVEALKAFESTMKTICSLKRWEINGNGTAASLIKTIFENNLIPQHFQTQLTSLKTTLEGLATTRNKHAGHGQGETSIPVPDYLVSYALHLCATNILFIVSAYKESL